MVVEYETPTGRLNKGVATTWMREKAPQGEGEDAVYPKMPVYVRRSQFRLPNRPQTPVIMIGPGTGLAPFRGFIQVLKRNQFHLRLKYLMAGAGLAEVAGKTRGADSSLLRLQEQGE